MAQNTSVHFTVIAQPPCPFVWEYLLRVGLESTQRHTRHMYLLYLYNLPLATKLINDTSDQCREQILWTSR